MIAECFTEGVDPMNPFTSAMLLVISMCVLQPSTVQAQLQVPRSEVPNAAGVQSGGGLSITASVGISPSGRAVGSTLETTSGFGYYDLFEPVAVCQNVTLRLVGGTATLTPALLDAGSSDNVGIAEKTLSKTVFTSADLGENQVTFTVRDYVGLTDSCVTTVTVIPENASPSLWMILGN